MRVEEYSGSKVKEWNEFVKKSKNGTFLHEREYMDYHADRFSDNSLMFYDDKNRLKALLPASLDGNTLISHAGLTYGGLLMSVKGLDAYDVLKILDLIKEYAVNKGIQSLIYKSIPYIYYRHPAEEDIYALFRNNATIEGVNISSVVDLENRVRFDMTNRRNVRIAIKSGVRVEESDDFASFWEILVKRLGEQYSSSPVHTLEEIKLLKGRFPDNIKLYIARLNDEIIAGTVVYITDTCVHTQYIASTEKGRRLRAYPLIADTLIESFCGKVRYFDFGTSNEEGGRYLNASLLDQKYRLGGRGVAYTTYRLNF